MRLGLSLESMTFVYTKEDFKTFCKETIRVIPHYKNVHPFTDNTKDMDDIINFFKQIESVRSNNERSK